MAEGGVEPNLWVWFQPPLGLLALYFPLSLLNCTGFLAESTHEDFANLRAFAYALSSAWNST